MDESSLLRLFNIISDELHLLPCQFRLWEMGTLDKAFTHRIHRILTSKDYEMLVASHAKDILINVYVETLAIKELENVEILAEKTESYREIRAKEQQWLEALRVELMKLPLYQDTLLAVGTASATAGGGTSTDASTSTIGTSADIDPVEGCGIGSSNKPLQLLTTVNPTAQKAFEEAMERLDEEMLTWIKTHCVDSHPNSSMIFFKAYDPNNLLPSPPW